MYKKLKLFQQNNEDNINLLLNHLVVAYMFFLSFIPYSRTVSSIFFVMYILLIVRGNYIKYLKLSLSHPITQAFLALLIVHYLWLLGSTDAYFSKVTIQYSYYLALPFFFFLFLDQKFYARFIGSFILGVMLSELLSYLMQFHLIPWGYELQNVQFFWKELGNTKDIFFYGAMRNQPAPFFEHALYSILISMSASFIFYKFLFVEKTHFTKLFTFMFFLTLSINLFFIAGRVGYLIYFFLLLYLAILFYKNHNTNNKILLIFLLPLLIIPIMYLNGGVFTKRVDLTINTIQKLQENTPNSDAKPSSFTQRISMAKDAIEIIKENPIFGIGTGDQLSMLRSRAHKESDIHWVHDVHNQYLDIFMQFGIIGFLIYLNILYQIFRFKSNNEEQNQTKNLSLITIIITGFFASYWYFLPILFSMLIVITTLNNNIIKKKITPINTKIALSYFFLILFSYALGQVQ